MALGQLHNEADLGRWLQQRLQLPGVIPAASTLPNPPATIFVNPRDHGALGGGADDAVALQETIDYAAQLTADNITSGQVYFEGQYRSTAPLNLPAGVDFKGAGDASSIQFDGCDGFYLDPPPDGRYAPQTISGFTLLGPSSNNSNVAFTAAGTTTIGNSGIRRSMRFMDLRVLNFNVAFSLRTVWDTNIERCIGYACGNGITLRGQCVRIRVDDCDFNPNGFTSHAIDGLPPLGLYVTEDTYDEGTFHAEDVQFIGNTFLGYSYNAKLDQLFYGTVRDNIFDFAKFVGIQIGDEHAGLSIDHNYIALDSGAHTPDCYGILAPNLGGADQQGATIAFNHLNCGSAATDSIGILLGANHNGYLVAHNLINGFDGTNSVDISLQANEGNYVQHNRCRGSGAASIDEVTPTGENWLGPNLTTVGTLGSGLEGGGEKITNVADGVAADDVATVGQVTGSGFGDVTGPGSATADHVTTFNGTTGKIVKDSGIASAGLYRSGGTDVAVADGGTGSSTAAGARTNLGFADGTYTPTLTNTTNVAASTAYVCQYMRVGNTVTVSGKMDLDATASAALTTVGISLPIASDFANDNELGGTAATNAGTITESFGINADATNNRALMQGPVATAVNHGIQFHFTYQVI